MATLFIDHQPHNRIVFNSVVRRDSYTDTVALEMQLPKYSVGVVCSAIPGTTGTSVVAVGGFRRSLRVTSYQRRYELSDIAVLDRPIPLQQLIDLVLDEGSWQSWDSAPDHSAATGGGAWALATAVP